jgi:multidrug resistance efflux pump
LRTPRETIDPRDVRRLERLQAQIAVDREALQRWMRKLKRSFHEVEKLQASLARREKQLAKLTSPAADS